jgi:hypothetical protein
MVRPHSHLRILRAKKLIIIRETVSLFQVDLVYQCAMNVWIACERTNIFSGVLDFYIVRTYCNDHRELDDDRNKVRTFLLKARGSIQR